MYVYIYIYVCLYIYIYIYTKNIIFQKNIFSKLGYSNKPSFVVYLYGTINIGYISMIFIDWGHSPFTFYNLFVQSYS